MTRPTLPSTGPRRRGVGQSEGLVERFLGDIFLSGIGVPVPPLVGWYCDPKAVSRMRDGMGEKDVRLLRRRRVREG